MSRTRAGLAAAYPRGHVEVWGPLQASWTVRLTDSGSTTYVGTYDRARSTVAYFQREGRTCNVTRTETCPAPGCNGDGTRSVRKRGYMFLAEVPCKGCRGQHDTAEEVTPAGPFPTETLTEVLATFGMEHRAVGDYGAHEVTLNGWPMQRGTANAIWLWLRETGRVL